ncbi:hypothetical protein ES332_D10G120000v1 [Gossypium tomentosum]|uniref:GTP cyclohydrolase II domain-containing protein n=1 Tax=Gossypium tomentosum TaxID=34277 RepID=A0A5D2J395_GOSTO|nr:hypothetical protein ES332_D10G120000v1 [Gossypium tomentosum]
MFLPGFPLYALESLVNWNKGYNYGNLVTTANRCNPVLFASSCTRKMGLSFMGVGKVRAALVSGEADVLSYPKSNGVVQAGIEVQPNAISFETLAAEITPVTNGLFADEYDFDHPTKGFASIREANDDIRQGKLVIVVDDGDRENEGDLIMEASMATPKAMAFIVKHGTGIVCVSMKTEDLERLELPLMVTQKENEGKLCTAFTVSVKPVPRSAIILTTTAGVSARDRVTTVLALASKDSKPEYFNLPASVDLAVLAGLEPVAILCEIVDDDGSMAGLPKLHEFAQAEKLKIISTADLIKYRRKRERLVDLAAAALIPTMWGPFKAYCYRSLLDGIEHTAMVKGEISDDQDILVRVHSECLTGYVFGSARCDSMKQIEASGRGVLIYLRGHEGRGIGLGHKLLAYNLQDDGHDTVEANEELYLLILGNTGIGAQILGDLGVHTMSLMTNNPAKYVGLKGYGLAISGRVPLLNPITKENKRYLETKIEKLGHIYGSDINASCSTAYQEI